MNNFDLTWNFNNLNLSPPRPSSNTHPFELQDEIYEVATEDPNEPHGPLPASFNTLPIELQDAIYQAATEPNQPQIRFVQFREHRTHQPDCSVPCTCLNARYLTFHPLRRQDVAHEVQWQPSWRRLVGAIESSAPDVHVAGINHHSQGLTDRLATRNRFPQEQGDWSLTTVSTMTAAERAARRITPRTFLGDPTRCRQQDLVLVHFPDRTNHTPHQFAGQPMFFDPLCGQLEAIAVTMDNWKDQSYSRYFGYFLSTMVHDRARSWQLLRLVGAHNVANGNYPANWSQFAPSSGDVSYPLLPQRKFDYSLNSGIRHMGILYDIFTNVKELWLLDLDALDDNVIFSEITSYREYTRPPGPCEVCKHRHDGPPKVFGGLDAFDFLELRLCVRRQGKDIQRPWHFGIAFDKSEFQDCLNQLVGEWPTANDVDHRGNTWQRSRPALKLLVPIPKMR